MSPFPASLHRLLADLVAFDTTSHLSNVPAADYLANYLAENGCRIARFGSPDGEKVTLLAAKGPDTDGGLILSGHLDVVPAGEPSWASDPFHLLDADDRFVGRGACDMKAFVALAAELLAEADGDDLRRPLWTLFTYDEEVGTIGAQHFVEQWDQRWVLPRAAIIGEPTELRVVRMHKGHLKIRVEITGRGAHSGYPHLGDNAIEKLGRVIQHLALLREEMETERHPSSDHFPETPHIVINPALVRGGAAINIVPDECVLDVGVRLLPDVTGAAVVKRIANALNTDAALTDSVRVQVTGESPALHTKADATICRALCNHLGTGETHAVHFASDAGPLAQLGVECVLYGPGSIEVAHRPNEFIRKAELLQARETLGPFVHAWCS